MLAIWLRLNLPFGAEIGPGYEPWPLSVAAIVILSTIASSILTYISTLLAFSRGMLNPTRQFRMLVLSVFIIAIFVLFVEQDVSQLQIIYMLACALTIGTFVIFLPGRLRENAYSQLDIRDNLTELWQKRGLLLLWLWYRIEARYAQTFLGIVWVVLLPLSMSLVLAFAFGELLGGGTLVSGVSSMSFLLAGIAIFGIFRDLVLKSRSSVIESMSIIGRVYFPREIIIVLLVGEVFIDFMFVFIAMLLINASQGLYPDIHYLLVPIPVLILAVLSTGIGLMVAWLGILVRDLQQLLTVVMQLMFYITVLYSPEHSTGQYDLLVQLIPITPVIVAFRDIILFQRDPDYYALFYPIVMGITLLYFGYVYFKVNEDRFVDLA